MRQFCDDIAHSFFGAILPQVCYVSTLCVDIAHIRTFAIFAQNKRMRQPIRQICGKKICTHKKGKNYFWQESNLQTVDPCAAALTTRPSLRGKIHAIQYIKS